VKLSSLQTTNAKFVLGQFDQLAALVGLLGLDLQAHPEDARELINFKNKLMQILGSKSSGVIIDPNYGFESLAFQPKKSGLAIRLEDIVAENERQQLPRIIENWGIEQIKNNYSVAKFELFYHPSEAEALTKKQIVAEIYDFCKYEQIDFLLQLRIFNPMGGVLPETEHPELQLTAIQELRKNCDLLALEYPGSSLSSATVTAELDTPWILLSHHEPKLEPYELLKAHLRETLENGAVGISAGSILWADLGKVRAADMSLNWEQIENFLKTSSLDRIAELQRIILES